MSQSLVGLIEPTRIVTFTRFKLSLDEPPPSLIDEMPDPRGWKRIFDELASWESVITEGYWDAQCGRIAEKPGEAMLVMHWRYMKYLDKFKASPLYLDFLKCLKLDTSPNPLVIAVEPRNLFTNFFQLTQIHTISFAYPATADQRAKFEEYYKHECKSHRWRTTAPSSNPKFAPQYDVLWLLGPQDGQTEGEKLEQALVLHEWGTTKWKKQNHAVSPESQRACEQRLGDLNAFRITEETVFFMTVLDDVSEYEQRKYFRQFLGGDPPSSESELEAA